ncbi:MAG: tRNA (adenosine(37)-N6)-dimethylallyltransferase MiaA [Clostridia bacterium]|nr:tRNA (adenosine(37)-N6)-dimethylallyltransferase MiaA [Clostridia bacterium]MDE7328700.1 tRNA (adenosine(37)-N6)-dimethylallyltransferase MiaA [Clostridia bacterium]
MNKIVIIAGATASGKSDFAIDIAEKLNGEIVSCDSMQIYKNMDIGTAKIKEGEMRGVKHHIIDIVEPFEEFSVGEYSQKAKQVISEIIARGAAPIIVGGTGLYIDSIIYPMTFGGSKDIAIRKELEQEYEKFGGEYMYRKLVEIDPDDANKIHPNNVKRVLRALEIYRINGKRKSDLQELGRSLEYDCRMVVLNPPRDLLYERINIRVERMFKNDLQLEVEKLLENGVSFDMQSMQAIGYKEFKPFFDGEIDETQLKEKIKQNSRNYAKRQVTWLKKYDFAKWFDPQSERLEAEKYILNNF